jgi:HEAT repeat protein
VGDESDALPAVKELLGHPNKYVQGRAVYLLPFLGDEGVGIARGMLDHKESQFRILAMRALRNAGVDSLELACVLASDSDVSVRREVAVALRDTDPQQKRPFAVELLKSYQGDRTYLEACGFAAEGIESEVQNDLLASAKSSDSLSWTPEFARITGRLKVVDAIPHLQKRGASSSLSDPDRLLAVDSLAFIDSAQSVPAMVALAKVPGPVGVSASQWLIHLSNTRWSEFGVQDILDLPCRAGLRTRARRISFAW